MSPSRTVSSTLKAAVNAQQTGECFVLLLKISHDDLGADIFLTNCGQNVTSNGDTYLHLPFMVELPPDLEDRVSTVEIRIDNIDQTIVQAVRSISTPPDVFLSVVLASAPDTVEVGPFSFKLRDAQFNSFEVSGTLAFEDILSDVFPKDNFDAANFPGLFS